MAKCDVCNGTGKVKCTYCLPNGGCEYCLGHGFWSATTGIHGSAEGGKIICDKCEGSGTCPYCRRSKIRYCNNCRGTGEW